MDVQDVTYHNQIRDALRKGQLWSIKNSHACMRHCVNVEKAEKVYKDCIKRRALFFVLFDTTGGNNQ